MLISMMTRSLKILKRLLMTESQRNKIVQRNQKRIHVNRNQRTVVNKAQRRQSMENEIDLL